MQKLSAEASGTHSHFQNDVCLADALQGQFHVGGKCRMNQETLPERSRAGETSSLEFPFRKEKVQLFDPLAACSDLVLDSWQSL